MLKNKTKLNFENAYRMFRLKNDGFSINEIRLFLMVCQSNTRVNRFESILSDVMELNACDTFMFVFH